MTNNLNIINYTEILYAQCVYISPTHEYDSFKLACIWKNGITYVKQNVITKMNAIYMKRWRNIVILLYTHIPS